MQEEWHNGNTRELFLLQMLPDLLDKVTRVVADNLHIDRLTVFDSGDGNGIPKHIRNLTTTAVAIIEQLKNATGLDLPGILNGAGNNKASAVELPKELV